MKQKAKLKGAILCAMLLSVTFFGGFVVAEGNEVESNVAMIEVRSGADQSLLDVYDVEIMEWYDNAVLARVDNDTLDLLEIAGFTVDTLPKRTTIYVKGYEFDFTEGEPDIPAALRVNDYEPGEKGLYIVHMIGPIAAGWRPTLEEMGVQVLNYMHNHAYRVRMTPELANEVSELYFVDWIGIYHPYYKIQPGLEAGIVEVMLLAESSEDSVTTVFETADILSFAEFATGEYYFRAHVISRDKLHQLANINDVSFLTRYTEPELFDEIATQLIGGGCWFFDDEDDDPSTPYRKHGDYGSYMNQIGYEGEGIIIAIADTGIGARAHDPPHDDFQERIIGRYSYDSTLGDFDGHGTHCAGSAAGNTYEGTEETIQHGYYAGQGSAPAAELYDIKVFTRTSEHGDLIYIGPDPYIYDILLKGSQGGAAVHSNSWRIGDGQGTYGTYSSQYDKGVRDFDMVVTVAAGNSGSNHQTITQPATGKNVITVGATLNSASSSAEYIWSSSSRGWTQDNRIKPDVMAPGVSVTSTWIDWEWDEGFEVPISYEYGYSTKSGTSMATPAVAGAAAVTMEWYEVNHGSNPSPAMVKALLINTANDLCNENGNTGPIPNRDEGWGIVDISKLERPLEDPVPFYLYDQEHVFDESGQIHEHLIIPDREGVPLKFSLVWTDKEAGNVGDDPTLMNDLNLEVIAPCGAVYRGNAFNMTGEGSVSDTGYTFPDVDTMTDFDRNEDGWDDTNNVENVYIPAEDVVIGNYTVRIRAKSITEDSVGLGLTNSQDYALAVYNAELGNVFPTVFNMRGHQHMVNYLEAYKLTNPSSYELNLESSTIQYSTDYVQGEEYTVLWGIRVFIRDVNGDETQLDPFYGPKAIVSRNSVGEGYQNALFSYYMGDIPVEDDDAIVVRVYSKIEGPQGGTLWTEQASFITDKLEEHLNGSTYIYQPNWNITYYTRYDQGISLGFPAQRHVTGTFYWGNMDKNSRVEGILFTQIT